MANPQPNRNVKISSELYDAFLDYIRNDSIKPPLNITDAALWLKVVRDTYGFNCKSHLMTDQYLAKALGKSLFWTRKSKKKLLNRNMITLKKDNQGRCVLSVQKDYEKWVGYTNDCIYSQSLVHTIVSTNDSCKPLLTIVSNQSTNDCYQQYSTEEYSTKENSTAPSEHLEFFEKIKSKYPNEYKESDNEWLIRCCIEPGNTVKILADDTTDEWYKTMRKIASNES